MTQQSLAIDAGGISEERAKAYGAHFTPPAVAWQGLQFLAIELGLRPTVCLDPSAGAGVFGMVGRLVWPESVWYAVEPRLEELPHIERHYHRNYMTTLGEALEPRGPLHRHTWELIATNPPFQLAHTMVEQLWPLLEPGAALALYLPSQWGQEAAPVKTLAKYPPSIVARIPGRIRHSIHTNKVDRIMYSWFVWTSALPLHWRGFQLPMLASHERRWKVRPGTESPAELALLTKAFRAAATVRRKDRVARRR